ncbi:MAG: DeoR/GlpR transcriptional regulator [Spirochaetaceae bacterium]|nr:MAG: DeoR/GlpR transcriptional regulator [Spirochaetaceae bacterium]
MTERQKNILRLLSRDQELAVTELAEQFQVSGVTIRQDLDQLQNQGLLRRVHGGAVLHSEDEISTRIGINYEKKLLIAERALSFIKPGETIFIESGSVNAVLARQLKDCSDIHVVTNNLFVARTLKDSRVDVIILGGLYQHDSESVVGPTARRGIEAFNFTKCFIGVDGFDFDSGFTCSDMMRAEVAAAAVSKCPEVFVLTDSTKFGRIALSRICRLEDSQHLVTDHSLPKDYRVRLEKSAVELHICE